MNNTEAAIAGCDYLIDYIRAIRERAARSGRNSDDLIASHSVPAPRRVGRPRKSEQGAAQVQAVNPKRKQKSSWDGLTPAQRKARIARSRQGILRWWKDRKAAGAAKSRSAS